MDQAAKTPLLDRVQTPQDLRRLPEKDLRQLCDELRQETIDAVSVTGGHLGAGLGVVELTVALHWIFDTPNDRLIWDVGHQAYPHKILTGRRDRIRTLRQGGGLSGFTKRAESQYDTFGAAHSSTSISAGLGMAVARDLAGAKHNVVCVIGDGAMSAGMAYEAMNNAGAREERLIVILNDNDMSIAPPVGALSTYLARISSSGTYLHLREVDQAARQEAAQVLGAPRGAGRGIHPHLLDRRHAVRGAGLLLPGADRRPRPQRAAAGACGTCATPGRGRSSCTSSPRRARAIRRPRPPTTSTTASTASMSSPARRSAAKPNAPGYTKVFAQSLIEEAQEGRQDRRRHRGDAVGHRPRSLRQGVPRAHLRCRHRRAARRHLCRRPRRRRLQAVRRHLLDLPAARLRPGRARRRHPAPARALCARPRRARRRRRADARRGLRSRLSRLPAGLRADGGRRRGRAQAHGGDRGCHRRPPVRLPLSARRGHRRRAAGRGAAARDRQGPDRARGLGGGAAVARHAARRMPQGGRPAGRARPVRRPWRTRALPSRSTPI